MGKSFQATDNIIHWINLKARLESKTLNGGGLKWVEIIINLLTILPESALSSELISLMLDGTEGCKLRLLKCSRLCLQVLPLQSRDWTRVGPGSQLDLMHWTRCSAPPALRSSSWSCEAPGRRWR